MNISKEKIKQIRKLHDKKGRSESGLFLVEGRKMILELLSSDWKEYIEELYVSEKIYTEIEASFSGKERENSSVSFVSCEQKLFPKSRLSKIIVNELQWGGKQSFTENLTLTLSFEGEGTSCKRVKFLQLLSPKGERIQVGGQSGEKKYYQAWTLVLDGIRDPGNMGTILRTASWFGIQNIVCSQDSVELYNPKVVSATMGALFHLQISYMNLQDFYEKNTLPVYAAELGGKNIAEIVFPKSGVLVMGSESHGISEVSKKYMTQGILIPKIGYGESLNVGIATGILLSHIVR